MFSTRKVTSSRCELVKTRRWLFSDASIKQGKNVLIYLNVRIPVVPNSISSALVVSLCVPLLLIVVLRDKFLNHFPCFRKVLFAVTKLRRQKTNE